MSVLVQISIKPARQNDKDFILKSSLFKAKLQSKDINDWRIRKRSIDARQTSIKLNLQIEFWLVGETRIKQRLRAFPIHESRKRGYIIQLTLI